jgi:hypothetical protein
MQAVGRAVTKVAAPILGRRGFGEAQMVAEWSSIVGSELARDTLPLKLSFSRSERSEGTLHMRVGNGTAPIVQHLAPQIIERINGFFGYRAVARLSLHQGTVTPRETPAMPPSPLPLSNAESAQLEAALVDVESPMLRDALERLGRSVLGTRERTNLHRK